MSMLISFAVCAGTQLAILYRGLQLLRVNGRIVYSTCSLNPLEDEVGSTEVMQLICTANGLVNSFDLT